MVDTKDIFQLYLTGLTHAQAISLVHTSLRKGYNYCQHLIPCHSDIESNEYRIAIHVLYTHIIAIYVFLT